MTFVQTIKRFSLAAAMVLSIGAGFSATSKAAEPGYKVMDSRFIPSNPGQTKISFVRLPDMTPSQFVLRVTFPVTTSGCAQFIMPPYQTSVEGNALKISLLSPALVNLNQPRHPEYECSGGANAPHTDIHLSLTQMFSNEINKIILQDEEYGMRKDYMINVNGSFVELYPASAHDGSVAIYEPQELTYKYNSLKYWFYPEDTVILYVPMADPEKNLAREIAQLAEKKGLIPLSKRLNGFTKPVTNPNYFYYVPKSDAKTIEVGQKIGSIKTTKTVYGLLDDETVSTELDVFVKTPGLYE
jgi:hypothetical protein